MGIDLSVDAPTWQWDIVAINVVGSALLGGLIGWYSTRTTPWWVPGVGSGVLGGFTTFSAMAAPHPDARVPGAVMLVSTLLVASAAAGLGWRAASALSVRGVGWSAPRDAELVEAEVEGFDSSEVATR